MKRTFILTAVCAFAITSCSFNSENHITERKILRIANSQIREQGLNYFDFDLNVGTYECNDALEREALRKMEAAGLISYDVARYAWWEKTLKPTRESYQVPQYIWGYYYGTETKYRSVNKTVYDFEDHYVVTVSLTKKGERCLSDNKPLKEKIDKDLEQPDVNPTRYAWNQKDISEVWPEIPNPFIEPVKENTRDMENPEPEKQESEVKTKQSKSPVERIDSLQYVAYQNVEEKSETIKVKGYKVKAVKARDIRLLQFLGINYATADVIFETKETTDFGRILSGAENGMKTHQTQLFTYYLDKGWVSSESIVDSIEEAL